MAIVTYGTPASCKDGVSDRVLKKIEIQVQKCMENKSKFIKLQK